ncbi:MAG: HAD hydrolase family protein [Synergistaceae bacterium]|nr:HAD hydrolase family protein [Synergistaceae bacterium]
MLFASDLDNTLIHSYRVAEAGDICVETRNGKKLSFMSPKAHSLLKDIAARCTFVPVTTRSLEQYRRLDLGVKPKYAMVANGAMLLIDGEVDEFWASETRRRLNITLPEIEPGEFLFDVRRVDDFFIFAKSTNPPQAVKYLEAVLKESAFEARSVHDKVYILPAGLDKGVAVKRLKERISSDYVICAGDSELDLPMLEMADMAIVPETLGLRRERMNVLPPQTFTSELLRITHEMVSRPHVICGRRR